MPEIKPNPDCGLNSTIFTHPQCCCKCKYHIEDFYHCTTAMPLRDEIEKLVGGSHCICSMHKGWICMPPWGHEAYSGWVEHSIGCEMYEEKTVEGMG
jgi:hypothetical protein